jgi:hypothetical protein
MLSIILNLPYSLFGAVLALFLRPTRFVIGHEPFHIIFYVRNDSFGPGYTKGWRGMTNGHVIILNPREEQGDLAHELVHVQQYDRLPFIFPGAYYYQLLRHGYRNNKYEEEAYSKAGNIYRAGKQKNDTGAV